LIMIFTRNIWEILYMLKVIICVCLLVLVVLTVSFVIFLQTSGDNSVRYFDENNQLVQEKVEHVSLLSFLYKSCIGSIIRPLITRQYLCMLAGIYKDSWLSKHAIKSFIKKHEIIMQDFIIPESGYQSFNDFFCRKLRSGARTIDTNKNIIVSPADCKLFIIDNITRDTLFFVKQKPFNLEKFLNSKKLAQEFEHGTLMIFRLAPYDYHRFHFPVDCIPSKPTMITGRYESVNPLVYKAGIQPLTHNERHIITLQTHNHNDIIMIPVGALFVGKIVETYTPEISYNKGDETGYFAFGGSTVVLLFKQNTITPIKRFLEHSQQGLETAVKMGQAITE